MSYTSLDVVDILYSHIRNNVYFWGDFKKPTGGLYQDERPLDSELEDIVINSLPLNREAVQQTVLMVNIYVPNIKFPDRPKDKNQPDRKRLKYLTNLFNLHFAEIDGDNGNYTFRIQQDYTLKDENNQHYQNFRIEFSSVNI